eukprot:scpid73713/ scgid0574/ 
MFANESPHCGGKQPCNLTRAPGWPDAGSTLEIFNAGRKLKPVVMFRVKFPPVPRDSNCRVTTPLNGAAGSVVDRRELFRLVTGTTKVGLLPAKIATCNVLLLLVTRLQFPFRYTFIVDPAEPWDGLAVGWQTEELVVCPLPSPTLTNRHRACTSAARTVAAPTTERCGRCPSMTSHSQHPTQPAGAQLASITPLQNAGKERVVVFGELEMIQCTVSLRSD